MTDHKMALTCIDQKQGKLFGALQTILTWHIYQSTIYSENKPFRTFALGLFNFVHISSSFPLYKSASYAVMHTGKVSRYDFYVSIVRRSCSQQVGIRLNKYSSISKLSQCTYVLMHLRNQWKFFCHSTRFFSFDSK